MDLIKQIKALREEGYSRREIVAKLACSQFTVSKALDTNISDIGRRIIDLRSQGLTLAAIKEITGHSKSTISKWSALCPTNDKIIANNRKKKQESFQETRNKRQKRGRLHNRVGRQRFRKLRKRFLLDQFDNKCAVCNYNKCEAALDFHHIDPTTKLFELSGVNIIWRTIEQLISEAEKCALLCCRCHTEVHNGIEHKLVSRKITCEIPDDIKRPAFELTPEAMEEERKWLRAKIDKIQKLRNVHIADEEFDLSEVLICKANRKTFDEYCAKHHYLGQSNKGGQAYHFIINDRIIGGALITSQIRKSAFQNACELGRFVLSAKCQNLASKCLSLLLTELKSNTEFDYVQAFSQDNIHLGTIYKAANFRECGGTRSTYNYNGIHKKTIYEHAILLGLTEHQYAEIFNLDRIQESAKTKFIYKLN